jgi:CheY-like chemotaxis protein
MAPERKRILVVDDEADIVELIRYNLTKKGSALGKERMEARQNLSG